MNKSKKGVELSMNVIIIAAIGLLVLVILAVLVINAANKTNTGMSTCTTQGGICQAGSCTNSDDLIGTGSPLCTKTGKPNCCRVVSTG